MRHGSLFSGIGGFDLAAEWMGWENKFHCEWNPFGQKVLHHYFPNAEQFTDITKTDFTKYANKIDILTGGFPCQPYSSAGKRLGKEDERHLWPEMLRAIREIQPRWVVGENVLGLVNWSRGLVFHEVQADLEAEGYEVQPYVLPAVSVNAPHRRDRVWFVAYSNSNGFNQCNSDNEVNTSQGRVNALGYINKSNGNGITSNSLCIRIGESSEGRQSEQFNQNGIKGRDVANTTHIRQEYALENGELERRRFRQSHQRNAWDSFPSVSPIRTGDDGISDRLDGITFPKWRNESIKAGGNAIVPQVVYQIFKTIEQYEIINNQHNTAR
jgi:DNA (cytosine-5)-methyltransferase 1